MGNWSERVLMGLGLGIGLFRMGVRSLRLRSEMGGQRYDVIIKIR